MMAYYGIEFNPVFLTSTTAPGRVGGLSFSAKGAGRTRKTSVENPLPANERKLAQRPTLVKGRYPRTFLIILSCYSSSSSSW